MKLICNTIFGSHLYGTATPASDLDIRGVFLPSKEQILLGKIPRSESQKSENEDKELYSLHHFLKLALEGQTVALDMLFSSSIKLDEKYGYIWNQILDNRNKLLSKNINAFIGYARTQASKYSLKGNRLVKLELFRDILLDSYAAKSLSIGGIWDLLPKDDERINPNGIRELQISGKWFGETTSVEIISSVIDKQIRRYGNRAKLASETSKDWKALSHAVRVAYECLCILQKHEIVFPLYISEVLTHIKLGRISFEEVQELIDHYIGLCELAKETSTLPEKPNHKFWDDWLVSILHKELLNDHP